MKKQVPYLTRLEELKFKVSKTLFYWMFENPDTPFMNEIILKYLKLQSKIDTIIADCLNNNH